jgi:hypothetical protein
MLLGIEILRDKGEPRSSDDAPGRGEKRRPEGRTGIPGRRGYQRNFGGGLSVLRRAISPCWRRLRLGFQREMGEGSMASIRKGLKGVRHYGRGRNERREMASVSGVRGRRWGRWCRQVGSACQTGRWAPPVGGENRERGLPFRFVSGPRLLGQTGLLGSLPFFSLFFFFFCFLFYFISFAIWLQTDSNNFVNFSKIQSIKVGQ